MEQKRNSNKITMTLGLLFFLVILPGGSWYYLSKGLAYQKGLRAELTKYGDVPVFQLNNSNGELIDSSVFSEKVAIVSFITPQILEQPKKIEILSKLYDQFDKKDQSRMVVFGMNWPAEKMEAFQSLATTYKMDNPEKCFFLTGDNTTIQQVLNQGFKWPSKNNKEDGKLFSLSESPQDSNEYPYFILINKNREMINYYDYRDEARMKTMVEHVAISIPLEKRKKPKLKRKKEK